MKAFFTSYFGLLVFCCICCRPNTALPDNAPERPQAFLHVGPPKTGSTYLQDIMEKFPKQLESQHVLMPREKPGGNFVKHFTLRHLDTALAYESHKHFINSSSYGVYSQYIAQVVATPGAKALLSDEDFFNAPLLLKELLSGFDVTVIYVYRDELSRLLSGCNQMMKTSHDVLISSCASFIQVQHSSPHVNPGFFPEQSNLDAFKSWVKDFKIIDMYGAMAAKQDLGHVFFCEVMGVLCNLTANGLEDKVQTNPAIHSEKILLLRRLFDQYAKRRGCPSTPHGSHGAYFVDETSDDIMIQFFKFAKGTAYESPQDWPLITYNLYPQVLYSMEHYRNFRDSEYGASFLYGNGTANNEASVKASQRSELNSFAMLMDPVVQNIFDKILHHIVKKKKCKHY